MASNFYNSHGFPQCIGAANGTHLRVKRQSLNASHFINRKGKQTLNIQASPDYSYCFFDVAIQWSGSVHDTRIFSNSKLNTMFREVVINDCSTTVIELPVPICFLGIQHIHLCPI